ncbi:unnamed protein product, partial [Porites evermanni]
VPELEADRQLTDDGQTYAKEQLRVKPNGAKLLGLSWDKKHVVHQKYIGAHRRSRKEKIRVFFATRESGDVDRPLLYQKIEGETKGKEDKKTTEEQKTLNEAKTNGAEDHSVTEISNIEE